MKTYESALIEKAEAGLAMRRKALAELRAVAITLKYSSYGRIGGRFTSEDELGRAWDEAARVLAIDDLGLAAPASKAKLPLFQAHHREVAMTAWGDEEARIERLRRAEDGMFLVVEAIEELLEIDPTMEIEVGNWICRFDGTYFDSFFELADFIAASYDEMPLASQESILLAWQLQLDAARRSVALRDLALGDAAEALGIVDGDVEPKVALDRHRVRQQQVDSIRVAAVDFLAHAETAAILEANKDLKERAEMVKPWVEIGQLPEGDWARHSLAKMREARRQIHLWKLHVEREALNELGLALSRAGAPQPLSLKVIDIAGGSAEPEGANGRTFRSVRRDAELVSARMENALPVEPPSAPAVETRRTPRRASSPGRPARGRNGPGPAFPSR